MSNTLRLLIGTGVALAAATAYVIACGPMIDDLDPILDRMPAGNGYMTGDLGVVRPQFDSEYLVQAYRVFGGRQSLGIEQIDDTASETQEYWPDFRDRILGTVETKDRQRLDFSQTRDIGDYQSIDNCPDSAVRFAVRTGHERIRRFGAGSPQVRDWVRAQAAVFHNCSETTLLLPEPAPPDADATVRADRAYQTAAAYFYATDYEEAAQRFNAIAEDRTSEWRPYGRFLAARARIREATVKASNDPARREQLFTTAEAGLKAALADPAASGLHKSAEGLLGFVALRLRPAERARELAGILSADPRPSSRHLDDYQWLLARTERSALVGSNELTDWVLTLRGDSSMQAGAVARWRSTRSTTWLVAALWHMTPGDPAAADALAAASALDRASPAFPTVAFLRARLLIQRGAIDEARRFLATLPTSPGSGFDAEALNLIRAERLRTATTLDEFVANAAREVVADWTPYERKGFTDPQRLKTSDKSTFDYDAARIINRDLTLDQLVGAASSRALPPRLRRRVAVAALTRALLLGREPAALKVLPVVSELSPALRADLQRYKTAATPAARHAAAILLLLRTPGMRIEVQGIDNSHTFVDIEPARRFDHMFTTSNWWCRAVTPQDRPDPDRPWPRSPLIALLYSDPADRARWDMPSPPFVSDSDRAAVQQELTAIRALGSARVYLATEALAWAKREPVNPDVAEALAQVVEGWRWTYECGDGKSDLSRRAFATLHQQFPKSTWAQRTKYWY